MRYRSALKHAATGVLPAKTDLHHVKHALGGVRQFSANAIVLIVRLLMLVSYPFSVPLLALALVKNETLEQKQAAATLDRALEQRKRLFNDPQ